MQAEPLLTWPEPIWKYAEFIAEFIALGAVGFRYAAVRGRMRAGSSSDAERSFYVDAAARAAIIGLVAQIAQAFLFWHTLPNQVARSHAASIPALLTHNLATGSAAVLVVLGVIGLALAAARLPAGWPLAAIGVLLSSLTDVVDGKWMRLVNPVHRLVGSLWLGTLFVLVVAGLARLLRDERVRDRRGAIAADLVNGFSPLALTCGMLLVASGLTTAWRHLNPLSSLWTTPYGMTLILKLLIVAFVFGLGYRHWKHARPALGTEPAAVEIRRTSTRELTLAAIVLAVTAILVSLPSPHPPGGRSGPGGPGGPPPTASAAP